MKVSKYRNLTSNFESYALYLSNLNTEYQMVDFDASNSLTGGTITVTVKGRPFTSTTTTSTFLLKPNSIITEQIFKDDFDEVEDFLLNREKTPIYTTTFKYPDYDSNGDYVMFVKDITWPLDGFWNLDIRTNAFDSYLQKINDIAEKLDEYKTNLLSRFLILKTGAQAPTGE